MDVKFKIENIVASANLDMDLDLYAIARELENVEYEPEQFPGAILKLKEPKTSLLVFKNGKMICTGAKNEAQVYQAIEKAVNMIKVYKKTGKSSVKATPVAEAGAKAAKKAAKKPARKAAKKPKKKKR